MQERPILFSGPMVRAILEGRKTQTRRVIKQAIDKRTGEVSGAVHKDGSGTGYIAWFPGDGMTPEKTARCYPGADGFKCPYGQPGDRLWVKETWQYYGWTEDGEPFIRYAADNKSLIRHVNSDEWAEKVWDIFAKLSVPENYNIDRHARERRWRPSIHMPRWASRITLRITDIRVDRLQGIKNKDAMAEGVNGWPEYGSMVNDTGEPPVVWNYIDPFRKLWDSINGNRTGCSWDSNPWVWVVCFEVTI